MTLIRGLFLALLLTGIASSAFGSNKDAEAAAMIAQAKQLSDIRAEVAPPFVLKLGFKVTNEDGSVLQGTYSESWASNTQWRRETVVADMRRTEVATDQKRWVLESGPPLPALVRILPAINGSNLFQQSIWKPGKFESRELNGSKIRCVEAAPAIGSGWQLTTSRNDREHIGAPTLCFDTNSGVLAAEVDPDLNLSCVFSDYEKRADHLIPGSYQCIRNRHVVLEAKLIDFAPDWKVNGETFVLPGGVIKRCPDNITAPRVIHQVEPNVAINSGAVSIAMTVGTDGAPHDLTVQSPPNPNADKRALEAVRQWRFRPASCDGEPIDVRINIDMLP